MKLCKSNIFVNKIFQKDEEKNLRHFMYDTDPILERMIVSETPEIIYSLCGERQKLSVCRFETEKQFNNLAVKILLDAAIMHNNKVDMYIDIIDHFENKNLPIKNALISNDCDNFINSRLHFYFKNYDIDFFKVSGLPNNQIIFTPEKEYVGIVSVGGYNLDQYAIGLFNSSAPIILRV